MATFMEPYKEAQALDLCSDILHSSIPAEDDRTVSRYLLTNATASNAGQHRNQDINIPSINACTSVRQRLQNALKGLLT